MYTKNYNFKETGKIWTVVLLPDSKNIEGLAHFQRECSPKDGKTGTAEHCKEEKNINKGPKYHLLRLIIQEKVERKCGYGKKAILDTQYQIMMWVCGWRTISRERIQELINIIIVIVWTQTPGEEEL